MREGWTLSDLEAELSLRGMTLKDTELDESESGYWMGIPSADECADYLEKLKAQTT